MTRQEIDELKRRSGEARSACTSLASNLNAIANEGTRAQLETIGDFLRGVENVLTEASDVIDPPATGT
jgi:hypothetical protein